MRKIRIGSSLQASMMDGCTIRFRLLFWPWTWRTKTKPAPSSFSTRPEKLEWVKIGLQTYLRDGPDFVREVADSGKSFPRSQALRYPEHHGQGVGKFGRPSHWYAHPACIGWIPKPSRDALNSPIRLMPDTLLLAVTVLTSMDQEILSSIGVTSSVEKQVDRLASLHPMLVSAVSSALPLELSRLRPLLPDKVKLVPGIRPSARIRGDQRRIMTPGEARQAGADYLVIGRPILSHENPAVALAEIQNELNQASNR